MRLLTKYSKQWMALALGIFIFLCAFLYCDNGHDWGDDFAAYMMEGIAIANGTLDQQIRVNAKIHPTGLDSDAVAGSGQLVYVWGFPMALSAVYKLVGYDLTQPAMLFYYKLPGMLCFAVFTAVLFLFLVKRFQPWLAIMICLFFDFSIFYYVNDIMTDVPFLCFSFLCFYLYELLSEQKENRKLAICGVLLGFSMWYLWALRLNGFTVICLIAGMHGWRIFQDKEQWVNWKLHLLPYVLFGVLYLLSQISMPHVTSNMRDVGAGSLSWGLQFYWDLIRNWIGEMIPYGGYRVHQLLRIGLMLCFAVGLLTKGLRESLFYTVFIAGSILVNAMLPYDQGLRYILNVLPFILIYIAYGMEWFYSLACRVTKQEKLCRLLAAAGALVFAVQFYGASRIYFRAMELRDIKEPSVQVDAYAAGCREAYAFLRENTPEDAVVVFDKIRVLYLNTHRMGLLPNEDGSHIRQADYYMRLVSPAWWEPVPVPDAVTPLLTQVFNNGEIEIYAVSHE